MPIRNAVRKNPTLNAYKQLSYETLAASWLLSDGWEVFTPMIDHGEKTDLLIADKSKVYRIQVKSVESKEEDCFVENKWGEVKIDFVIYFSRNANWGYIARPFSSSKKRLNAGDHIRFHQHPANFAKAFKRI